MLFSEAPLSTMSVSFSSEGNKASMFESSFCYICLHDFANHSPSLNNLICKEYTELEGMQFLFLSSKAPKVTHIRIKSK